MIVPWGSLLNQQESMAPQAYEMSGPSGLCTHVRAVCLNAKIQWHVSAEHALYASADDVYMEVKKLAKDAMLAAIEKERNGDQIDRSLLKNVLGIFIEVGMGGMDCYDEDFEQHLLAETASYYRKKATVWITVRFCSPAHALAPHP